MNKIVLTIVSLTITASSLAVFNSQYNYPPRYSTSIAPEYDYNIVDEEIMETQPAMVSRPHPSDRELSGMQQEYLTPLSEQTQTPAPTSTKRPQRPNKYHG